jgi:predicted translin family RNA/ssDNA-binding protein
MKQAEKEELLRLVRDIKEESTICLLQVNTIDRRDYLKRLNAIDKYASQMLELLGS